MSLEEKILFDPCKVRLDLTPSEAFRLTAVRSLEDYRHLRQRLPEIRGISYFFINRLEDRARLMVTIITAEGHEVTASFALNHDALGISYRELMDAACDKSGNYPLPPEMERKVRSAMGNEDWRFFKVE